MTARSDSIFDMSGANPDIAGISQSLGEYGYAILRGLFPEETVASAYKRVQQLASTPAVAGVPGYYKVDHPKKFIEPFLSGRVFYDLILDERVIEAIETHMGGDCVLGEGLIKIDQPSDYVYFDLHSDFAEGWRKNPQDENGLSAADMQKPIGIGGMLYFHDTASGAFSYCEGTHKLASPHGQNLATYPEEARREILSKLTRLDGKAGDFAIFDDRGFHGPDQPSTAMRTVLLLDYYSVDVFGYTQVSPVPVLTGYLKGLSDRQKRVLGLASDFMVDPDDRHTARFRSNRWYPMVRRIVDNAWLDSHLRQRVRKLLRGK